MNMKNNDKVILKYFQTLEIRNLIMYIKTNCVECNKYRKLVNPNISLIFDKNMSLFICNKCAHNNDSIFKKEDSTEILKILGLIE